MNSKNMTDGHDAISIILSNWHRMVFEGKLPFPVFPSAVNVTQYRYVRTQDVKKLDTNATTFSLPLMGSDETRPAEGERREWTGGWTCRSHQI